MTKLYSPYSLFAQHTMTIQIRSALSFIVSLFLAAVGTVHSQESYPLEIRLSGPAGAYDLKRWKQDWPGCKGEDGVSEGRVSLIQSDQLKWLRVTCQANQIGPEKGGISWRRPIPAADRVELAYMVKFSEDFDFSKGGKLPGLCGGPESVTGGNKADGKNGFSARFMWRKDGRGEAYLYHMDQPNNYGESLPFPDDIKFPRNQPFKLIMRIDLNQLDGTTGDFEAWIQFGQQDAIKLMHRSDMRWRSTEDVQIDSVLCEVFHGGNDASWAPAKSCTVDLADFKLY